MKILDNINHTVREDLQDTMQKGSRVSIAAACFSIYAYQELKKQLEEIAELRFIFTSPTFVQENTPKERREFYIPKLTREKSLYGTEFEVRLRNELTQKALAKECADWVRRKVKFRSNVSGEQMLGFPPSTEFNKRIPKQKFYENAAVPAAVKRYLIVQSTIFFTA